MRQLNDGVRAVPLRAVPYFDAHGDAGGTRSWIMIAADLKRLTPLPRPGPVED
ncbi:hypothetical protein [Streptomyces erythrochromogenes]|uniref:hypothetical protein n=1 Tax=Streptomyces erythrochromogenes TaxID=285574 RepID=UPI0038692976|nr:hypothetical protein OG489_38850 [Streptomyces erythrochromogenes]